MFYRRIAITSVLLFLIGLTGLAYVIFNTLPTLGPRWLFFFFLMIGVSGLAMPIAAFLNYRFQGDNGVDTMDIIRESVLVGACVDLLVWLQMGQELTGTSAMIIVVGFILIEILIRVIEHSRWKPNKE
ncbi:MAG: hypothetical protein LLG42_09960 [Chloroflexi bacterium]|nr:hypothetical protein [Chloroflexota bacterium]